MKVYEMAGELMIGSRLKRLSEKFLSDVSKVYKSQGIPFETAYFPVFYLLNLHGTLTVSHVARELEITQSGASQMINSLVKKGLVRYDKDKDDKRIRRASFTPRGILLLDQVEPVWESIGKCFRTILEQGDNSRYLFQALGEIEESIAKKNLFSRVSKDLEKKNLLKKVIFSLYDPSLEKEYKALALSWLVENSFAKTFDTDFINKTGRMVEKGLGIVRLAKIEKNVVGAFYLSKIGGDRSEILVFSVEDSRENPDLAQLLLSRLLETMKEEKITRVSIRLNRRLAPLIKLFRGAGFSLDCLEKHKEETGFVLTKKA